jgi:2,4-dienoyl-CoA reductase-like NADH-dependent reductase (Old Yellow Enzyme family)
MRRDKEPISEKVPTMAQPSQLFSPLALRGVTARNRVAVSPMCQYSARDGHVTEWHDAHHARFALGGVGIAFVEATGVEARGRITHGCTGIWSDAHVAGLSRVVQLYKRHGVVPGIQIAHAGRKASSQRPWEGGGPLAAKDAARGDAPWETVGPSPEPMGEGWHSPHPLSASEIVDVIGAFAAAARRARQAGFEALEIHGAHGYLVHSFLSPISNRRNDAYGGDLARRMRFALEVAEAVRAEWPAHLPLFYRASSVDGVEGGLVIEDTVELAKALKARGVDVIDCSSGGVLGPTVTSAGRARPKQGFQVPYAERVRRDARLMTMCVGMVRDADYAEAIVARGRADIVALGRELLYNPNWALHAAEALGVDPEYASWPVQYTWSLSRRAKVLAMPADADDRA